MAEETGPIPRRRFPWALVQRASIAIAVVALGLRLRDIGDGWSSVATVAGHQFALVVAVMLLSVGVRLRSSVQVLGAALGGFFTATWIAYHGGGLAADLVGADSVLRTTLAIPVVEELAKGGLLLIAVAVWRRRRTSPGIVDMAVAGMAVGAGFALHEDLLWERVSSSGFVESAGWVLPSIHTATGVVAGHMVWTGLVGLAVGYAVTRRAATSWLVVAGATGLAILDHGTWNDEATRASFDVVLLGGWLPIGVFVVGLLVALLTDASRVRRFGGRLRIRPRDVLTYTLTTSGGGPLERWLLSSRLMRAGAGAAHERAAAGPPQGTTPPAPAAATAEGLP